MSFAHPVEAHERICGFDLLRLLAFLAIMIFHASWIFWADTYMPAWDLPTPLWRALELYARLGDFSGFAIVFLSSFLFGGRYARARKRKWLIWYLLTGWVVFNVLLAVREHTAYQWVWDIYPLLAVGLYSSYFFLRKQPSLRQARLALVLAVGILAVPFWQWQESFGEASKWQEILVGRCPQDYADWPLFPWLGLVWSGCLAGYLVERERLRERFLYRLHWREVVIWLPVGLSFFSVADAYFYTPLANQWACFNYRQPPYVFLAHLLGFVLVMRLCLLNKVQDYLRRNRLSVFVSNLAMSRHFFLAYLLHYVFIFALQSLREGLRLTSELWFLDVAIVAVPLLTEMATGGLLALGKLRR